MLEKNYRPNWGDWRMSVTCEKCDNGFVFFDCEGQDWPGNYYQPPEEAYYYAYASTCECEYTEDETDRMGYELKKYLESPERKYDEDSRV